MGGTAFSSWTPAPAIGYNRSLPLKRTDVLPPVLSGHFSLGDCAAAELADAGALAARWLTPPERRALEGFPAAKRRADWLAGRAAAKRAAGLRLGLSEDGARAVEIVNEASGRPSARSGGRKLALCVSITHGSLGAAAAVSERPVGCDWQTVEALSPRVVELFAHESERGLCGGDAAATRLWARKEAALKLLGLGLGVDPRDARFTEEGEVSFFGRAASRWRALGAPEVALFETLKDGAPFCVAYCAGKL